MKCLLRKWTELLILSKEKASKDSEIIRRNEQRDRKRHTDIGFSLISGRFEPEIRPLGEALCLARLRLPVIIIKAASPTATAEQSSHLERHPVRRKIKKDRTAGQQQDDGYIKSNEEYRPKPSFWQRQIQAFKWRK